MRALGAVFVVKQKTAYEIKYGLVGSEMCIRDRPGTYTLTLSRRAGGTTRTLGDPQTLVVNADPAITLTPAQITSARDYQERVFRLQRTFTLSLIHI